MQRNWKLYTLLVKIENDVAFMENNMEIPEKLKIEKSDDPVTPRLCIYSREQKPVSQRAMCLPVFVARLLTIAKR